MVNQKVHLFYQVLLIELFEVLQGTEHHLGHYYINSDTIKHTNENHACKYLLILIWK